MVAVTVGGVSLPVHRLFAPIVHHCLSCMVAGGYRLVRGQCWGYANRPIGGTHTPSNHSWGLAVDLNSLRNPQRRPLRTDMPRWVVDGWKAHGCRWGGDYVHATPDPMHFEYERTPGEARFLAANLRPFGPQVTDDDLEADEVDFWIMQGDGKHLWLVRADFTGRLQVIDPQWLADARALTAETGGKVRMLNDGQVRKVRQGFLDQIPVVAG